MAKKESLLKSILLVDDTQDSLDMYAELFRKKTSAEIKTSRLPGAAIKMANKHFFDFILIDVTMDYNGTRNGGLEVYKTLKDRYGDKSIIAYSQYFNDNLLKLYDYEFNYIETGIDPFKFTDACLREMNAFRKEQTCFVAMPFSSDYDDIFNVIENSVDGTSYRCIRTDQQQFTKSITAKIFTEIRNAKLIIFLATDQNPNAFYECGYSIALNKEVITLTDSYDNLPFDIKGRNAIEYGDDLQKLMTLLKNKLKGLTHIQSQ